MQPFSNATEGRSDYTGLRMSLTDTRECGYHDKPNIIVVPPVLQIEGVNLISNLKI